MQARAIHKARLPNLILTRETGKTAEVQNANEKVSACTAEEAVQEDRVLRHDKEEDKEVQRRGVARAATVQDQVLQLLTLLMCLSEAQ